MAVDGQSSQLIEIVALLSAGVIAVPVFKRLKLGSVLAYFVAGLAIGPFGIGFVSHPETILHVAEFGIIMLLFVIGLEMRPAKLWSLRREIFGLGAAQVTLCGALLTLAGMAAGLKFDVAFIAGMGFVLSSTAVVMQMLEERGDTSTPAGYRAISILLLEDLMIVPLLAVVAFMATAKTAGSIMDTAQIGIALAVFIGFIVAGKWVMNPFFRILAKAEAREVMTSAALLVVLGSALLMEVGGLSMAMGAFLAGVMLSGSSFRHQLEADIEPFRGILLGLFFLAVGMALDLHVVAGHWRTILLAVIGYITIKSIGIYAVARLFGSGNRESLVRISLFAQGGEFAFVLYAAALDAGILNHTNYAIFTATVIISMALTPITGMLMQRYMPDKKPSMDGIETASELQGTVLLIGFGRFSQVVSQALLARGFEVSIIESNVDMIRAASDFGFKVYYGDGTRLDVLRTSGAANAKAILVCVDKRDAANRIVDLVKEEFPLAKLYVRAYDRGHAIELIKKGVDYQVREMFESAMAFGAAALEGLGVSEEAIEEAIQDVRIRDSERLALQAIGDDAGARSLMRNNTTNLTPIPLTVPKQKGQVFIDGNAASLLPANHPVAKEKPSQTSSNDARTDDAVLQAAS